MNRLTRRGSVLMAVLVVVAMGAALGTSALLSVQSHRAGTDAEVRRAQSRALAWSGVQAVMREIAAQRDDLLAGGRPDLTGSWTLFEDELGRQGVVRLIDLSEEEEGLASAEGAKLDINRASAEMLARLPGVSEALAARIALERERSPFSSAEELLRVPGVTPGLLYGGIEEEEAAVEAAPEPEAEERGRGRGLSRRTDEGEDEREDAPERGPSVDLLTGAPVALIDLVTVYSFDPNVIAGLGELERNRGELRISLNQPWSEDLKRAIARMWNDDVALGVQRVMNAGVTFKTDSDIVKEMRRFGVTTDYWGMVLDGFCTSDDQFRVGRVDVMNARPEVLACLPGLDMDAARRIVERRDQVTSDAALSATWIVDAPQGSEGAISQEQYEKVADWVSVRSLQWRVRIEVGFTLAESAAELEGGATGTADADLIDAVVWDAVIDASAERPRLAYLRDVSMLEAAREIGRRRAEIDARVGRMPLAEPDDEGLDGAAGDGADGGAPGEHATGGDEGAPEEDSAEGDAGEGGRRPSALDRSRRGNRGFDEPSRMDRPETRRPRSLPRPGDEDEGAAEDEPADEGDLPEGEAPEGETPEGGTPPAVDRRIGRWTARGRTP